MQITTARDTTIEYPAALRLRVAGCSSRDAAHALAGTPGSDVGPRNRLHHSAGGPPQLIGPSRDPSLWEANNPANRARANADQIRDSGLAIYLEAADRDFLNAHDGAEFLHNVLWDLDLSHEYHLVRGADHDERIHPFSSRQV